MGNIFFNKSSAKASPLGLKRKLNETNDGEASDNESDDLITLQSKKFKYSNTTPQLNGSKMGFSFLTKLFKRDTIWSQQSKNDIHLIDSFRSCNTSISGSGSSSRHSTPESNKIASFSCLNSSSLSSKLLFYLTLHLIRSKAFFAKNLITKHFKI